MMKTLTIAAAGVATLAAVAPADAQRYHERVVTRTVVVNHHAYRGNGYHGGYAMHRGYYGRPGYFHRGYGWHRGYGAHRCFTTYWHGRPVRHCR